MGKFKFDLVVMAACVALLGYIGWHTLHGPRSFDNRDRLAAEAQEFETLLAVTESQRAKIDQRVQLMRPETVDPDMLDELARQTLDYALPGDLVVLKAP
jgi:cell division protein FtsB